MNILIIGGGGREHALAWKMAQSPQLDKLFIAPGNAGTAGLGNNVPIGVEDFEGIKKLVLSEGIDLPTTWNKETYDRTNLEWQGLRKKLNNKISDLKKTAADSSEISEAEAHYNEKQKESNSRLEEILKNDRSYNLVGAFEGAGYSAKGLYRPMTDCIMFSIGDKPFCKVCKHSIEQVINHYLEDEK